MMKIQRRDLLVGAGALALGVATYARGRAANGGAADPGGYFLSAVNPIANTDQRDLEALAIQLFARPEVQAVCKGAAAAWARVTDRIYSPEQLALFQSAMTDYCFKCTLLAINSDANFPKILRVYSPAAKWMGNDVPASKWGADNPDNAYRIIPLASGNRYVVHGQRQPKPPTHVSYQLVGNTSTSFALGTLEQHNLEVASDGSFEITLDDTPANGRKNHLQMPPETLYLFIRDSMGDWMQTPNALRVRRLTPPSRGPLTTDELAARVIRNIQSDVYLAYYFVRVCMNMPPQSMKAPELTGATGGLVTQVSTCGNFALRDDDAVIITATTADATYRNIVLQDMWNRSLEYRDHQSHLNNSQMAPDADGRFTFVISGRDPGVHNWLDTTGLHEILVGHRWQGIPPNVTESPTIDTHLVKYLELPEALPRGVRMVTPSERAQQLRARREGYDRRFLDS